MSYNYVPGKSVNIPNRQQLPISYAEYISTEKQQQPDHPEMYQQAALVSLPTYPVIISHQIIQQASPPESPRSLCSSSDESHQNVNSALPPKKKRIRTSFNSLQIWELEREYQHSMYMQPHRRQQIAQRLSLNEKHIKIWFQNRRMRNKRERMLSEKNKPQKILQTENISNESSDRESIDKIFKSTSQYTLAEQSASVSIELHQPQLHKHLPPPTESAELRKDCHSNSIKDEPALSTISSLFENYGIIIRDL